MKPESQTARAYRVLRGELISCRLRPSARLNISALQMEFKLSQASVREALSRLISEGLVEGGGRGFRAAPISLNGFSDLVKALKTVELQCLRTSIENGDLSWELNLVSTYHRALHTLELVVGGKEGIDAYWTERMAFYEALLGACDSNWLLWTWRLLYAQNMRYRQIYEPLAKYELSLNSRYKLMIAAVLERDVGTAMRLTTENYEDVTLFIENKLSASLKSSLAKPKRPRRVLPSGK